MNDEPDTARDLIGTYLAEQCTVIIDSEAQLRAGENVVHTTRVAVRRLRSTIRVFAELFDSDEAADLEYELVWWATLLGEVRDLDILAARQTALLAALPPELMLGPVAQRSRPRWLPSASSRGCHHGCAGLRALPQADRAGPSLAKRPAVHRRRRFPIPGGDQPPSRRQRRRRASGSVRQSMCGRPESHPTSCSIARARRETVSVRSGGGGAVWGTKAEKIVAQRKDLQDMLGPPGSCQDGSCASSSLGAFGLNGFNYGLLYARVARRHPVDGSEPGL